MGIVAERVVLEQAVVTAPPKHVRVAATVQPARHHATASVCHRRVHAKLQMTSFIITEKNHTP